MNHHLAFFYGKWTESEERAVQEAILWKESHTKLPPRKLGEPWVIMRQDLGDEYVFLAHRHGWRSPIEAKSPNELAAAIRKR